MARRAHHRASNSEFVKLAVVRGSRRLSGWFGSFISVAAGLAEVTDPSQGGQGRHEEVLAAAQHVECLDAVDPAPDRMLRDGERRAVLLQPDVRITFVAQVHE